MHFSDAAQQIIDIGRFCYDRGWVPATSGNFSIRLGPGRIAATTTGKDKGKLQTTDIMETDLDGQALTNGRPSAEVMLHCSLYKHDPDIGAVLHTHSPRATVLSKQDKGPWIFADYEILKAFYGINTHESKITVPVFRNDQNINRLAGKVLAYLQDKPATYVYVIEGHGLYTWGRDVSDARRHLEAIEFLLECDFLTRGIAL